ncbi:hypothetical protein LXL04_013200 [Taraxacum kok-saghyz]
MGRGKVELKRIEDKSSLHVSFSKRRSGLMKKSHDLGVLCNVDVALFVFSSKGRLYEYSTDDRKTGGCSTNFRTAILQIGSKVCKYIMVAGFGSVDLSV